MAKLNMNLILLIGIVVASMEFQGSTAQNTHIVGDGFGWAVPQNDGLYAKWASQQNFHVNDVLLFNFATGLHTVAEVTKEAYNKCDGQNPILLATTGPAKLTINTPGDHYYICTIGPHCNFFLKLAIKNMCIRKRGVLTISDPKEAICFYCQERGHWKRSCLKYLEDLKMNKAKECGTSGIFMIELHSTSVSNSWVLDTGCGTHICSNFQGLKESRTLKHGELNLIMGNRMTAAVTKIGDLELVLSSGLSIKLLDCCYSPEMARNIISFHALYKDGFKFKFDNDNGCILVYKNDCFYFKATPCNGVYESVICVGRNNNNLTLNVGSSNSELDKSQCCGIIILKRIAKLQSDGILETFDLKSDEECESCLLGKMTKSPFKGKMERGKDLLDLIHTNECGPFRSATRNGERYFCSKGFKNEVENQLGKKIKMLRSDRGGEYLSHEFYDYLRDCGIVSQLSSPRTPQLNGVAERRNRTLLDMVRSMMSRATLPMSFWDYALETTTHILNLVPTKKVAKTPSEMSGVVKFSFGAKITTSLILGQRNVYSLVIPTNPLDNLQTL
ncbi:hypothetical protein OSB04_021215 [Centaurea solstitialis]|uniref:Integrase catalytic domain-containing protein n=1 Tax=Centaurea solstitialis TaxID=347529 RepID=A0AA38W6K9_9ASTR|nr:hypothetical protein OSB04_021215 [Centaurea solstitialis]